MDESTVAEHYQVLEELGRGSFGVVYKGIEKATGQTVAIKHIDLESSDDDIQEIQGEISVLSTCASNYVTQYKGCFLRGHKLWIVMEYLGGGSCLDLLKPGPFLEAHIAIICRELLLGLEYLHAEGKIHRDIKAANILLSEAGRVKLADFGVAAQLTHIKSQRNTFVGTPFWMAPEVIQQNGYSFKADIWSLGITAMELANGEPPLAHIHPMKVLFHIPKNPAPRLEGSQFSRDFKDFVAQCLDKNDATRPTARALLRHKFIRHAGKLDALQELILRRKMWVEGQNRRSQPVFYQETLQTITPKSSQDEWVFDTVRSSASTLLPSPSPSLVSITEPDSPKLSGPPSHSISPEGETKGTIVSKRIHTPLNHSLLAMPPAPSPPVKQTRPPPSLIQQAHRRGSGSVAAVVAAFDTSRRISTSSDSPGTVVKKPHRPLSVLVAEEAASSAGQARDSNLSISTDGAWSKACGSVIRRSPKADLLTSSDTVRRVSVTDSVGTVSAPVVEIATDSPLGSTVESPTSGNGVETQKRGVQIPDLTYGASGSALRLFRRVPSDGSISPSSPVDSYPLHYGSSASSVSSSSSVTSSCASISPASSIATTVSHSHSTKMGAKDTRLPSYTIPVEASTKEAILGRRVFHSAIDPALTELHAQTSSLGKREAIARLTEAFVHLDAIDPEGVHHLLQTLTASLAQDTSLQSTYLKSLSTQTPSTQATPCSSAPIVQRNEKPAPIARSESMSPPEEKRLSKVRDVHSGLASGKPIRSSSVSVRAPSFGPLGGRASTSPLSHNRSQSTAPSPSPSASLLTHSLAQNGSQMASSPVPPPPSEGERPKMPKPSISRAQLQPATSRPLSGKSTTKVQSASSQVRPLSREVSASSYTSTSRLTTASVRGKFPGQPAPPGLEHVQQLSDVLYSRWADGLRLRWPAV